LPQNAAIKSVGERPVVDRRERLRRSCGMRDPRYRRVEHHERIVPAHSVAKLLDDDDVVVVGAESGEAWVDAIARSKVIYSIVRGEGVGEADDDGRRIGRACAPFVGVEPAEEKAKGGSRNGDVDGRGELPGRGEFPPDSVVSSRTDFRGVVAMGLLVPAL
jgi:hypothetical protein